MSKNTLLSELINYISANSSGNVVIAAPTSGFALDVTGTGRFTGALTLGSTITNGTFTYTLPSATGTLALTSSLGSYLPLSGGTLTGALNGTSAAFSSSVTATLMGVGMSSLSSWGSPFSVTEYPYGSYVGGTTTGGTVLGNNNYYNGTSYIYKNTDYATQYNMSGGNHTFRVAPSGTAGNAITWTPAMTINSSGNVGFGTTSPQVRFEVAGLNGNIRIYGQSGLTQNGISSNVYYNGTSWVRDNSSYGAGAIRFDSDVSSIVFNTDATTSGFPAERMRITSGGNVGINVSSPSYRLQVDGNVYFKGASSGSGDFGLVIQNSSSANSFLIRNDGLIGFPRIQDFTTGNSPNTWINPNSSFGIYINTSSIRYKRDVINYDKGLDILNQLRPVYYKGISEVDADKQFAGFIAEEVHDLGLTEFVNYLEDGRPNSLSYPNMLTLAVKAIQELKAELDTLKNK